jgi:hypothetical protein
MKTTTTWTDRAITVARARRAFFGRMAATAYTKYYRSECRAERVRLACGG